MLFIEQCKVCDGSGFCTVCTPCGYTNDDEYGDGCRCPEGKCCGRCHEECSDEISRGSRQPKVS